MLFNMVFDTDNPKEMVEFQEKLLSINCKHKGDKLLKKCSRLQVHFVQ